MHDGAAGAGGGGSASSSISLGDISDDPTQPMVALVIQESLDDRRSVGLFLLIIDIDEGIEPGITIRFDDYLNEVLYSKSVLSNKVTNIG